MILSEPDMDNIVNGLFNHKLLYAYIPEYRCVYDTNLNFTPRFHFDYEPRSKTLRGVFDYQFPSDFWPDGISSVSVIAGKNGAGKSSIIRWILERVVEGYPVDPLNGIIVFLENNVIKVYHDIEIKGVPEIQGFDIELIDTSIFTPVQLRTAIKTSTIYGAGHFDVFRERIPTDYELAGERNISDKWLLIHDIQSYKNDLSDLLNKPIGEHIHAFIVQNDMRICKLLLDDNFKTVFGKDNKPTIRLPKYISFTPNTSGAQNIEDKLVFLDKHRKENDGKFKEQDADKQFQFLRRIKKIARNSDINESEKQRGKESLATFLYSSLLNLYWSISNLEFFDKELRDWSARFFTDLYKTEKSGVLNYISSAISKLEDPQIKNHIANNGKLEKAYDLVRVFFLKLKEVIEFLDEDVIWIKGIPHLESVSVIKDPDFKAPDFPIQNYASSFHRFKTRHGKRLIELLSSDSFTTERFFDIHYSHSLDLNSQLSSGELGLLNLYSRIKDVYDSDMPGGDIPKPSLILLDEVEVSFHPEWQRKFIHHLTQFVSLIAKENNPIQIIYTTHSPITLSDMPEQSVNLLDATEYKTGNAKNSIKTFGANVFDLYGNMFFMSEGLVGEFASEKIIQLNKEIEDLRLTEDEAANEYICQSLKYRIELIGDDRIRDYLMAELGRKSPTAEIIYLKQRLAELEKRNKE